MQLRYDRSEPGKMSLAGKAWKPMFDGVHERQ